MSVSFSGWLLLLFLLLFFFFCERVFSLLIIVGCLSALRPSTKSRRAVMSCLTKCIKYRYIRSCKVDHTCLCRITTSAHRSNTFSVDHCTLQNGLDAPPPKLLFSQTLSCIPSSHIDASMIFTSLFR